MNKKIKTKWDLSLFYKNEKDPKIEKEIRDIEKATVAFEKKYKNSDYTSSPKKLQSALDDYVILLEIFSRSKAGYYFAYRKSLNSNDNLAQAHATKIDNKITLLGNKIIFFTLNISKIPKSKHKALLANKILKPYSYFLKKIFDNAKYLLSEKEEQIVDLLSNTSYSMWISGQDKLLSSQLVEFKGLKIPISKAGSMISELPKSDRDVLYSKINKIHKSISHFAESEINAVYNFKKVLDERRGYKKPYSASILSYENEEIDIENLVSLVTKNFHISKRFFRLHAKLLKLDKLKPSDRGVKIGQIKKKFTFDQSVSMVGKIFSKVGKKYGEIFYKLVNSGHVDVFPRMGKTGGAYCSSSHNTPTFILLNHTDDLRSLETLAHEMGHAVHSELSKSQPILYENYTMSSAEVASTFFEQVVLAEIESEFSESEKIILLHNRILGDIATIFMQIACFNFELELHNSIRQNGQLSKEEIARLLSEHFKSILGDVFDISEDDGYFFVKWSHIRHFFYVYTYAYGQIISRAFFENWKKDPKFIEKIDKFLSAGGSKSPKEIFKDAGIDISNMKFFQSGLESIEKDIERLEKMTKITKK